MQLPVQPEPLKKAPGQTPTQNIQTDWRQWDFSPLKERLTFSTIRRKLTWIIVSTLATFFISFIFIPQPYSLIVLPILFISCPILIAVVCARFYMQYIKQNQINRSEFAYRNGLSYNSAINLYNRPGTLFSYGHSKTIKDCFSFHLKSWPVELFSYEYVTGYGKSSRRYYATVAEVALPRAMPHMVLDSQLEDMGGSVLPIQFDKDQRIKLEGDFDNYIHLYTPENYQIAALSILTPDVMQALLSYKKYCDIEIIGSWLYFYWPGQTREADDYRDIMAITESVLTEIGEKLRHSDIFASEAQARVHAAPTAAGIRLKKSSIGWITVLFVVGYVVARANIFGEVTSVLITLAIIGPIAWRAWRTQQLRRRLKERRL